MKKASDPRRDPEIDRFIDSLWAQKGLAELTLSAYQQDLLQFSRWLEQQGSSLAKAEQASVQQFLAQRFDAGASARSNARLLSTLKQYYRHLVRLGDRQDNPTARRSVSHPAAEDLFGSPVAVDGCRIEQRNSKLHSMVEDRL